MLTILDLDKYRPLFKDDDSFSRFVDALRALTNGQQLTPLVIDGTVVGFIASLGITRKIMNRSLVDRATKNPELLSKLATRINSQIPGGTAPK